MLTSHVVYVLFLYAMLTSRVVYVSFLYAMLTSRVVHVCSFRSLPGPGPLQVAVLHPLLRGRAWGGAVHGGGWPANRHLWHPLHH